ncbi:MAG: glycosyltransferase family 39 protein, partial [Nitrososphaerales archaeon]|nr:glycosyltransferase family 39 protein [Nitrososphaerales archaeon]
MIVGIVFKIFGASYLVERSFMASLGIANILLTYFIAAKMYDKRTGLLAAFFLGLSTIAIATSRAFWLDNPMIFLNLLVFATILSRSRYSPLISGVFQGLAVLTKLPSLFLLPASIYLIFRYSKDRWHSILKFLLAFTIILSILPIYALVTGGFEDFLVWNFWQASRMASFASARVDLLDLITTSVAFDPLTLMIGALGFFYCIYKREWFLPIWFLSWGMFIIFSPISGFGSG